jgi:hypothetical protein
MAHRPVIVTDNLELRVALKRGLPEVIVEGELAQRLLAIEPKVRIAYAVGLAALGLVLAQVLYLLGPAAFEIGPWGLAALTAMMLGLWTGGLVALNKLRGYRLIKISGDRVKLVR